MRGELSRRQLKCWRFYYWRVNIYLKRVIIFIDGNNFEKALKNLYGDNTKIGYQKFSTHVAEKICSGKLQRIHYYTAVGDKEPNKVSATKNFVDYLNKHVPRMTAKYGYLKIKGKDGNKWIYEEKGTDVMIAVDMVSLAYNNAFDEAVLFSADTDFSPAISELKRLGKVVIAGLIDQQKAGRMKELCDDHFILTKKDIDLFIKK